MSGVESSNFEAKLTWQIKSRAKIQALLLELYCFLEKHSEFSQSPDDYWHAMNRMVATAFSLWRSAFLTDVTGKREDIYKHTKDFILKVMTHNAITFADDHKMSELSIVYYNNNARYRLERMYSHNSSLIQLKSLQKINELRIEGKGDIEKYSQDQIWDDLYDALSDCFAAFKADWYKSVRPAQKPGGKHAEALDPKTDDDSTEPPPQPHCVP